MLKVALRGLRAHSIRLVLTALAVIASVAFMSGTQVLTATITTSFDKVFDDVFKNIDAVVRSSNTINTGFGEQRDLVSGDVIAKVKGVDGVEATEGAVQGFVTILDKTGEPMGSANAGPPTFGLNWLTEPALNGWHLKAGRAPAAADEVVLDQQSAQQGGYVVGDTARVQTNKGAKDFKLVGTAGFGATDNYAGSSAALFDTKTAQTLLGEPGKFTLIEVAASEGVSQDEVRARIAAVLPRDAQVITGQAFTAESQDVFRQFFSILSSFLLSMAFVAMFVGSFIIYNTFNIIVAQRTRELALLRAMGASRTQVMTSVAVEAVVVGLVASVIGLLGGVLLASVLTSGLAASGFGPPVDSLTLNPNAFISSLLIGTFVTVASGIIPAWKASRVPPVAAMRDVAIDTSGQSRLWFGIGTALTGVGAFLLYLALFTNGKNPLVKVGAGAVSVILGVAIVSPHLVAPIAGVLGAPLRAITGRLARSNATRNPRRTAVTACALMIGVGLVVTFAIVINSVKGAFNNAVDSSITSDFVVSSGSFDARSGFDPSLASQISKVPGVANAVGFRFGFGQSGGDPVPIMGVDPAALLQVVKIDDIEGSLAQLPPDSVAVDKDRAKDRAWHVGDKVQIKLLSGGVKTFTIGSVYDIPAQRRSGVLMPLGLFEKNFPPEQQLDNAIYVKLAPGADAAAARQAMTAIVKRDFPTGTVQDLTEYKQTSAGFLDVFLLIVTALLMLAIIIAFIGIVNTLLLSVHERTHEIGLLRAVGMTRKQVRATVMWESVIISLLGTVLGTALGFAFSWALVRAISEQQPLAYSVPVGQLINLIVVAAIAGVIAAIYPAWRGSRLNVLAAIATE